MARAKAQADAEYYKFERQAASNKVRFPFYPSLQRQRGIVVPFMRRHCRLRRCHLVWLLLQHGPAD